jgi:hypothetical protein
MGKSQFSPRGAPPRMHLSETCEVGIGSLRLSSRTTGPRSVPTMGKAPQFRWMESKRFAGWRGDPDGTQRLSDGAACLPIARWSAGNLCKQLARQDWAGCVSTGDSNHGDHTAGSVGSRAWPTQSVKCPSKDREKPESRSIWRAPGRPRQCPPRLPAGRSRRFRS